MNWHGTKISVMEMSHRSKAFDKINTQAKDDFRQLMKVPDNFDILFM